MKNKRLTVFGGGSWGTALAQVASQNFEQVLIYLRDKNVIDNINNSSVNSKYFPKHKLKQNISATDQLKEAVSFSKDYILSVPTSATRVMMEKLKDLLTDDSTIISTAKGLEIDSFSTNSEIIREYFKGDIIVLSGPTHAEEVIKGIPTAIVAASNKNTSAKKIQNMLITPRFRIYTSTDTKGVEIGGAVKNIIAVASGVIDGIGYGDNTKAALITRGLSEIVKFGLYHNTKRETYNGLAGLGDLVVTCNSKHSRNRKFGIQIGKGKSFKQAKNNVKQVVEGAKTARAVYNFLKTQQGFEMPITKEVYEVLYNDKDPLQAVDDLMLREPKNEFYYLP
ncbi:MAG: NAD(P)-dependent glycerol-3-phosphate dehydrogenase [Halanaerobiales bacterium]|nr:NAD(P)-dependent glycerol-3-phosphate dehydrogenase [Halanaerobiales bacterium]